MYFVVSREEVVAKSEWAFSVTADRTQSRRGRSPAGSEPHRCGLSSQVRARQCGPSSCSSSESQHCSRGGRQTVRALTQLPFSLLYRLLRPPHRLYPPIFSQTHVHNPIYPVRSSVSTGATGNSKRAKGVRLHRQNGKERKRWRIQWEIKEEE